MSRPPYTFGHASLNPPETEVELTASVPVSGILEALLELGEDELIQFVKDLDVKKADWDFTLELASYFKAQRKAYKIEMGQA